MGAEGHIDVFDWKKIKFKYKERADVLLRTANAYIDEIKTPNGEVFKVYHGYYDYGYHGDYNDYDCYFDTPQEKDTFLEILNWAKENAQLFTWEVWT